MGLKRVMWVRRYQGQCRALRPLGHQGYRLRSYNKDQPLCSGYMVAEENLDSASGISTDTLRSSDFIGAITRRESLRVPPEVTFVASPQQAEDQCKVFVQPIFSLFSVQNPDICTPTENHDPSTVLDSVGISRSGISVVLHSWCFHHFLYNKTEFGSATASPEIARADPEIVDF